MTVQDLERALVPMTQDRVLTLRTLLRLTDEHSVHVLHGRLDKAATVQTQRDALLHYLFDQTATPAERAVMVDACCAMLDMDRAVLSCLENSRAQVENPQCAMGFAGCGCTDQVSDVAADSAGNVAE